MDALLAAIAASEPATALRFSRWGYAAANTAHVLGVALLVGAAAPLALRLLGVWRRVPLDHVAAVLSPMAAGGLALAVVTGALLFATRAPEYAAVPLLWLKLSLIAAGTGSAIAAHLAWGWRLEGAPRWRQAATGAFSLAVWLGALAAGRLIAFVAG